MDWTVVGRIWEKWAANNIGSSGGSAFSFFLQKSLKLFFDVVIFVCCHDELMMLCGCFANFQTKL